MCCRQRCFSTAAAAVLALQSFATVCTLPFLLKRWQQRLGRGMTGKPGLHTVTHPSHRATHFLPGVEVWWSAVWLATSVPHNTSATPDTLQHPGPLLSSPCQSPFAPPPRLGWSLLLQPPPGCPCFELHPLRLRLLLICSPGLANTLLLAQQHFCSAGPRTSCRRAPASGHAPINIPYSQLGCLQPNRA